MARALIVGCGCRGRELGASLRDAGWQVRGTTRDPEHAAAIEAAGFEAAIADPDRAATIVDQVADVALIFWLLASAAGDPENVEAIHGPRLQRMLEEIVDTPVRGFVYEAGGSVDPRHTERGAEIVSAAGERWRIPVAITRTGPDDLRGWREELLAVTNELTGIR
jgi:nucleoside-diphosphate-sugar epimerase